MESNKENENLTIFRTGIQLHQLTRSIDAIIAKNYLTKSQTEILEFLERTIDEVEQLLNSLEQSVITVENEHAILESNIIIRSGNKVNNLTVNNNTNNKTVFPAFAKCRDVSVRELYDQHGAGMWRQLERHRKRVARLLSNNEFEPDTGFIDLLA